MRSTLIGEHEEVDMQGALAAQETRGLRRAIVVIAAAVISAAVTLLEPDLLGYCPSNSSMDKHESGQTTAHP